MQQSATILSFDPLIRRFKSHLKTQGNVEPFPYNGKSFHYFSDRTGRHVFWKEEQAGKPTIIHNLVFHNALYVERFEMGDADVKFLDRRTFFKEHNGTFNILSTEDPKGSAGVFGAVLPDDIVTGVAALEAYVRSMGEEKFAVFPERFRHLYRTTSQTSGKWAL